ncbi:acyl-CoA carboxylase epsilon subunit [Streptomyces sp. NPDC048507]|uniref:acyl-CoA carboxylase epsilon subunit n=1 Tax=Streptomyces sp. NPDC048507 TaxID=3365560 RepID=UPI003713F6B7
MRSEAAISSLLRVHRGTAEPEELAAITVVVACLAGRAAARAAAPAGRAGAHHRPRPRPAGHGCWAGCWACG